MLANNENCWANPGKWRVENKRKQRTKGIYLKNIFIYFKKDII